MGIQNPIVMVGREEEMKVKRMHIENYGSLRKVSLEVGDLTVLIGKNGSGKSFLLEAVHRFFHDFEITGGTYPEQLTDYSWFDRRTKNPIRLRFTFEISDDEVEAIFTFPERVMKKLKSSSVEGWNEVDISRLLEYNKGWKTEHLEWCGMRIVDEDKVATPTQLAESLPLGQPLKPISKDFVLYFFEKGFSEKKIGGQRFVVDEKSKVAYESDQRIDDLVRSGYMMSSQEAAGSDFNAWAQNHGFSIAGRSPTSEEIPNPSLPIDQEMLTAITARIQDAVKGKFELVPAGRDVKYNPGERNAFIEPTVLEEMRLLSLSTTRFDELRWDEFRGFVERLFGKRLEPNPTQLLVRVGNLRLPISSMGGGEQEILRLMWHFIEKDKIFAVEEPENHLHSDISRGIFRFLRERSKESQILIATHSPVFVDKVDIGNNWLVSKRDKKTMTKRLESREDMKLVLWELGVLPSDVYLKDFVVLVEGGTEKEATIPIFAEKLGLADLEGKVALISIGGEGQLRNYMRIWLEVVEVASIEYLVILDAHAADLAISLGRELGIDQNKFFVLDKECIEDYYPIGILVNALDELYGVKIGRKDINRRKGTDKELKRILEQNNKIEKGWKVKIGRFVAERMKKGQIPNRMKEAIEVVREFTQS